MFRVVASLVLVVGLFAGPAAAAGTASEDGSGSTPRIVAVHPNPVAPDDAGEFVVVSIPEGGGRAPFVLTDGEAAVTVSPVGSEGRVTLSSAQNRTRAFGYANVRQLPGGLALSNDGEELRLRRDNETVDVVSYGDAPEGELLRIRDGDRSWRPMGATGYEVRSAGPGHVRAFVLPDGAGVPTDLLGDASERIRLAGYTLTSSRVYRELAAAVRRNVSVDVLIDGDPVGGMSRRQVRLLDDLVAAGVDVRAVGGPHARYDYHHAKYAVVDDRALVTTENWKPSGTGGRGSRGWGVVTDQEGIVTGLAETFRGDFRWRAATPWERYRRSVDPSNATVATGAYPERFSPARLPVEETRLLVAPDNAEAAIVREIDRATESVRILQMNGGSPGHPFVRAAVRAARRGVEVQFLLDSTWYVESENRAVVRELRRRARDDDLPLSAKLVDPRGRFEKVHAKGAILDGERVVLGSVNWNNHSVRENREVALVLEGEAVAAYFERTFRSDWQKASWRITAGTLLAVVGCVAFAGWRARRVRFGAGADTDPDRK